MQDCASFRARTRDEFQETPNIMAVAYSDKLIVKSSISGATPAAMIADLHAILIDAGWVVTTTLTGGFIFEITSAQSVAYKAHMLIQDQVNYLIAHPSSGIYTFNTMVIQMMNVAETVVGFPNQVKANGTFTSLQVICGFCQLFISVVGLAGGNWGSFACGIPWLPPDSGACVAGLTPVIIDDIWWSCGGSQFPFDFRAQANAYACMSYYRNGVVVTAADNNNFRPFDGLLCLFPLTAVNTYASDQIPWPTITYSTHNVLAIDAFVGWAWSIRGQLWDAYLQTAAGTLDAIVTASDTGQNGLPLVIKSQTWHSQFYSSLQLIYEITGAGFGNVAY